MASANYTKFCLGHIKTSSHTRYHNVKYMQKSCDHPKSKLSSKHAMQYLSFSNRIEYNLQLASNPKVKLGKTVILMVVLILCGYLIFVVPSVLIIKNNWSLHLLFGFNLLVIAINIHHFFIDGKIWKSDNLEMRQTLLAHLGDR